MKTSQIQRAIESLQAERAVIDMAIEKLIEQQTKKMGDSIINRVKVKATRRVRVVTDGVA